MSGWLTDITNWFLNAIKDIWTDFYDFLNDFWIDIAESILNAIASLIESIQPPGFLVSNSISSIISLLPVDLLYFVGQLNLSGAFAFIASGVAFRITRKFITLFQW